MKAALAATALIALSTALPASAQTWSSYGQGSSGQGYYGQNQSYGSQPYYGSGSSSRTWSSRGSGYNDYNGQQDRPGDYRCDAYWDRGRDDCDASWRDQRQYRGGHGGYRSSYRGNAQGAGYVYQPYSQGTQYYGAYGRPDQVYPGSGYGGQVGGGYSGYGQNRNPNRSAWCASQYRSYDANSGFYRAYSGRLVFCG